MLQFNRCRHVQPGLERSRTARKETFKKPVLLDTNKAYLRTDAKPVPALFAYATSKIRNPPSSGHSLVEYADLAHVAD